MAWDRKLWGVSFTSGKDNVGLLGRGWDRSVSEIAYPDEPTRPLLFTTRQAARRWCDEAHKRYGHNCPTWCFRAVRVRETVRRVK
jgi:hypothetical protein